jgi:biopolymer transport protein ExbB/TolQ|tara:strand:+ start:548 stop:952 length:405 start_codon:yes stop_codon:yes gene_type:complete
MGFKLTLILGGLLLMTVGGSAYWIDHLHDQISILKGNQIVLETEIEKQNESIKNYLEQQKNQQVQLNQLEADKQEAMKDVNRLRKTFANHDLDELALAKPGLLQGKVNKASNRVMDTLEKLSDPNQFNEKPSNN